MPSLSRSDIRRSFSSPALAAALAIGALSLAVWPLDQLVERRLIQQRKSDVALRLGLYANSMAVAMHRRLERVSAVAAFVESSRSLAEIDRGFPLFAARLMRDETGIRSIELQRDGVIDWVYPIEGNEAVLHADVRDLFGAAAMLQIDSMRARGRVTVTEPMLTLQGGLGVVARQGIRSSLRGAPDLVSIVVHLDSFMNVASLMSRAENLELVVLDRAGNAVSPRGATRPDDALRAEIEVPDGNWTLLGAPREGWSAAVAPSLVPLRISEVLFVLLLGTVVYFVVAAQGRLHRAVRARTSDLDSANQELRREIEERVKVEQTLRAQEEQLLHSQKFEAMGTLAGGVAHDFNNFLTVIIGFGELAEARARDLEQGAAAVAAGEIRADLVEVLRAAELASVVTNQLLTFSRKQVVKPVAVDLVEVIAEVEVLLGRLLGERIRLSIRAEQRPAMVFADRGQLVQVLMNFAVNARDAMTSGGELTIEVRRHVVDLPGVKASGSVTIPPGRYVELVAADSGVGMTPDVLERALQPFFTTKAAGKGTGLGLSTVAGIVQRAGGFLVVTSEPGHGTRFQVLLPELESPVPHARRIRADTPHPVGRATLLVAEDEPAVRGMVTSAFRRQGYDVLEASSGEAALAVSAATGVQIDLLITDIVMAGVDGHALAAELKLRRPGIKVLFVSGYSDEAPSFEHFRRGDAAFLAKPFTPQELLRAVGKLLEDERSAGD